MGKNVTVRADRIQRWQHRLSDTPASLEADARAGFDTERFYLLYQPRVSCADGEIRVVEALLRWEDSIRGDLNPAAFLPSLARTGVMGQIGRWVFHRACAQAAAWDRDRPPHEPPIAVAVNISVSELLQEGFLEFAAMTLEAAELRREQVQVELDARAGLPSDPVTALRLSLLRRSGISVTLDGINPPLSIEDTSLEHDSINLDRRWVRRVETDPSASTALSDLVRDAHSRSVTVTAIGVESQTQADLLSALGVDQIQGYHLSEPVPPAELGWQPPARPKIRHSPDRARRRTAGGA